jgi:hypothetical protein
MLNITRLLALTFLMACLSVAQQAAPQGWLLAGSKPADYETGVDTQAVLNGRPSAYLKSKEPAPKGFGTLMQDFKAEQYLGKRVRFSGFVRSEGAQNWAGLWMRVDKGKKAVAFDNMEDRPIKGTTAWQNYEVVLDVPQDATGIFFGILLQGTGSVWLNGANFEIVPTSIPTTGRAVGTLQDGPKNLDFQK